MKICFFLTSQCFAANGGVRVQALMWKEGLEKSGHTVDLIGSWDTPDWKKYDACIVFGYALGFNWLTKNLEKENPNIAYAPIIDPDVSINKYKFYAKYWGSHRFLGLTSRFHDLWLGKDRAKLWLARSQEEIDYIHQCLEIPMEKIAKVPLHFRVDIPETMPSKENFCFHASRLASPNKNVERIIEAAKKYGFNLKLAGHLMGAKEEKWLNSLIDAIPNIEYLGEVSDEELLSLYRRAKVFALPSLQEGVGMVALEAAANGCEVVLTNIGAPKEYYEGRAILVNPYSVDEIGQGIINALRDGYSQPDLMAFMNDEYSERGCMERLEAVLQKTFS